MKNILLIFALLTTKLWSQPIDSEIQKKLSEAMSDAEEVNIPFVFKLLRLESSTIDTANYEDNLCLVVEKIMASGKICSELLDALFKLIANHSKLSILYAEQLTRLLLGDDQISEHHPSDDEYSYVPGQPLPAHLKQQRRNAVDLTVDFFSGSFDFDETPAVVPVRFDAKNENIKTTLSNFHNFDEQIKRQVFYDSVMNAVNILIEDGFVLPEIASNHLLLSFSSSEERFKTRSVLAAWLSAYVFLEDSQPVHDILNIFDWFEAHPELNGNREPIKNVAIEQVPMNQAVVPVPKNFFRRRAALAEQNLQK